MSEILVYGFGFVLAVLVLITVVAMGRIDE
jgi:Na+-transporting methylmalonyl-CoA/oxaloacetate decarboxylase gamma subunit